MAATATRVFPPLISASRWRTAFQALWERALNRPGPMRQHHAADANQTWAPALTNAELVTLIMAWLATTTDGKRRFPLWYQFAAAAYGWGPRDQLDTSTKQAARWVPDDILVEFWSATMLLAQELDGEYGDAPVSKPRLYLDGRFSDPAFQGEVRAALQEDGAEALWKVPLPACKDENGKPGKPRRNPDTGKWECDVVLIDDPITAIGKSALNAFATVVLVVGALWWLDSSAAPRRRRNR